MWDVLWIGLKVYSVIIAINMLLLLFLYVARGRSTASRLQKERDDQIFEEVERSYGAPW